MPCQVEDTGAELGYQVDQAVRMLGRKGCSGGAGFSWSQWPEGEQDKRDAHQLAQLWLPSQRLLEFTKLLLEL